MVKKVAVINDLSGLGKCSLTAAIPVLSVMGVQACPLPTAILTNQTDFDSFYCNDYTDKIDYYIEEWTKRKLSLHGIYTGFLGSEAQVQKILHFCELFRKENTLLFVDPVMGDLGKIYDTYTPQLVEKMKELVLNADVITPNLTECCLLTGTDYETFLEHEKDRSFLEHIEQMARPLLKSKISTIIVTGIIHQRADDIIPKYYNLVITEDDCKYVSSDMYGGSFSGTGDLLASVVCAGMVRGDSAYLSVKRAVRFLEAALLDTVNEDVDKNEGINFEPYLSLLLDDISERIDVHTAIRRKSYVN